MVRFNRREAAARLQHYIPGKGEIPYRDDLWITAPHNESHEYTFLVSLERVGKEIGPASWRWRVPALGVDKRLPDKYDQPSTAEIEARSALRREIQDMVNEQKITGIPKDDRTLLRGKGKK
jgi:hypothetical protein